MSIKNNFSKKSLIDEVIVREILCMREDEPYIADVLLAFGMITTELPYTTDSDAWWWYDSKPSEKAKLKVLKEMGYDLSILK